MDPATVMMLCDAVDEGGRIIGSVAVVLLIATAVTVTGALFLGLAIRMAMRLIVRRFAERKI